MDIKFTTGHLHRLLFKKRVFYCSYRVFPVWLNCLKHCRKFTTFFLHFFWICPNGDKSQILDTWKNQNFLSSEIEKLTILHNTGTNTTTRCISHENDVYMYICIYIFIYIYMNRCLVRQNFNVDTNKHDIIVTEAFRAALLRVKNRRKWRRVLYTRSQ